MDSDQDEEDTNKAKGIDLNKLFAGKGDDDEPVGDAEDESDDNFQSKMSK